jgi:hypothetical protein
MPCSLKCRDTANRCPDCKAVPVGRLSVILPELLRAGFVVLITMETHGWNDIGGVSAQLVRYEPLRGKSFRLYRETARIGAPVKDKRAAVEKSLVRIELTSEWMQAQIAAQEREAWRLLGAGEAAGQPDRVDLEDLEAVPGAIEPDGIEDLEEPAEKPAGPESAENVGETDTTPAQEASTQSVPSPAWPPETVEAVQRWDPDLSEAKVRATLNLSSILTQSDDPQLVLEWLICYRQARQDGSGPEAAAAFADKQIEPVTGP